MIFVYILLGFIALAVGMSFYAYFSAKEMEETRFGMVPMTAETKRAINELKYMDDDKVFLTIGLDFDGTVVEHDYPRIGKTLPLCVETLKRWQKDYHVGYVLSTMRGGENLEAAVKWFADNGIELFGVQKHPTQETWTDSPKVHCRWMIDDRNVGQPLALDSRGVPCVDWAATVRMFEPTLHSTYCIATDYQEKLGKK